MDDFESALSACGVREESSSAAERAARDSRGYVLLEGIADAGWLAALRAALEALVARSGAQPGTAHESGTQHVADLAWSDPIFDGVYLHPRVLAAAHHVLERAFGVLLLSSRAPGPGFGLQGLHQDWLPRMPKTPFDVVTALWFLDDFTPTNGATRVVPGTHVLPGPLPKSFRSPQHRHNDEELIVGPAGSVLVFNGHLWHGGTRNESGAQRRALQCQYVAKDRMPPAEPAARTGGVPQPTRNLSHRLGPAARFFLRG